MKTIIKTILLFFFINTTAQVAPILDHTWTIEKIVTQDETIMADLNAFGEYDQFNLLEFTVWENPSYYDFWFASCINYTFFEENDQSFYNHLGCTLSSDSSNIAEYYNYVFIQSSEEVTLDNEFVPDAYGPFNYEFRYESDFIYLDITNTEGSVATFWASTLSNNDIDKTKFSIYPNPVVNELRIVSDLAKIEQIIIYNLNGKQILKVDFQENQPIDVSSLAKGMYLVKLQTENGSLTKKMIKE